MNRMNRGRDLTVLVDQFLTERIGLGLMSVKRAAHLRFELVGGKAPLIRIGYVKFLHSLGVHDPAADDLNGLLIGSYWEFLIQHYGALQAHSAMQALKVFWKWCAFNDYTTDRHMPADLKSSGVLRPYRVAVKVSETK